MSQTTTTPLTGPASAQAIGAAAIGAASLRHAPLRESLRRCADSFGLYAIVAPTFILLAVFSLVPFVIAIATSFFDYEVGGSPAFVGLANYKEYLTLDYTAAESFRNMLFLCGWSVLMVMIVPLIVAKLIFSLASERASYFYRILFL